MAESKKMKISIPIIKFNEFWDNKEVSSFEKDSKFSDIKPDNVTPEFCNITENITFSDYTINLTPLMYLIMIGSTDDNLINCLMKTTDKSSANTLGITPMMVAVAKNNIKMVKLLLENDFTLDQRDNGRNHVLSYVNPKQYNEMFELIIKNCVFESNILKDRFVQLLLFNIISNSENADYIINSIEDISNKTKYSFAYSYQNRKNILMYACEVFCSTNMILDPVKVIEYLIMNKRCNYNISVYKTTNNLIAHIATYPPSNNQIIMIKHLMKYKIPIDNLNVDEKTPLIIAVMANNINLVKYLITCPGVNINREYKSDPIMFYAAKQKYIDIVKVMYNRGCRLQNKKGYSLMSILTHAELNLVKGDTILPEYSVGICSLPTCTNRMNLFKNLNERDTRIIIYMGSNGKQYCNSCLQDCEPGVSVINCMIG